MRRVLSVVFACALAAPIAAAEDFKREGTGEKRQNKDKLEGKTPPKLQVGQWLNTEKPLTFEKLKGKVVVIKFWGVWCGPCKASMPHNTELYNRYKDRGLVFIGVHTPSQAEKMPDYAKEEKINWPLAVDADKETIKAFHVDSYPDYYLIDRAGKLRFADLANSELDRAVEALLKEPASTAPLAN